MKYLFILFLLIKTTAFSQTIKILTAGTKTSLRGLSAVNDKIIWVSGSNGTTGRSTDSGKTWKWLQVKGFENTDFRDIEAFDAETAIIMGIAEPAYILKTVDGGQSWKVVYENKTKGIFLDAMEFLSNQNGVAIGDPIDMKMFMIKTSDGGNTWQEIPNLNRPIVDSGEASFASSGTNVRKLKNNETCFITGGLRSRLFIRKKEIDLPILQGKESTGANSLAIKNNKTLIVVGGDFTTPDATTGNCTITKNGGKTWISPLISPHGYRSCVEYLRNKEWISCGLNGVDYSEDEGNTWKLISTESFHVCRKAKKGKAVFFAGGNGKIGKL